MPGIAGRVSKRPDLSNVDVKPMLDALGYGRARVTESYVGSKISLGCAHLGTGGQKALYQSEMVVVVFFGYFTQPNIPPGADPSDPYAAAHHIHDLYLAHGERMMIQLAGAFAFALWDQRNQTLLLASDHLGLRPIYYSDYNGMFCFASEIKGILADQSFPRKLNMASMADFFYYSCAMRDKTFFQDIQLLPPASLLQYHDGRWTITKYWDISYPEKYPNKSDQWYDELIYTSLQNAVQRMVRPDNRYALSLSGGLDSRWLAAFMAQVQPNSLTFTLGIPGSDDTPAAKAVADRTGLTNYYWDLSPTFVAEHAETFSYITDGMYDLFMMEEFPLSARVGDYADVSVGGFLGDPLFGHDINPVTASMHKGNVYAYWLWRNRSNWLDKSLAEQVFGKQKSHEIEMMAKTTLQNSIASAPSDRGFQVLQYVNFRNRQRRLINMAQIAKLPYIEIYHPFADSEVLQCSLQLPPRQLMLEAAYRRTLTSHFPDLAAIPWTFTLTRANVSVMTILLKKIAQQTLGSWLWNTPLGENPLIRRRHYFTNYYLWSRRSLRPFIEETLLSPEVNSIGLFDPDGLRIAIRDHMDGKRDCTNFIGQALAVAIWTRLFYFPSIPIRPSTLQGNDRE